VDKHRPLLVVQHVEWERPFRILDSFPDVPVVSCNLLDEPLAVLPEPDRVRGAVLMGGPMSVNDAGRLIGLSTEVEWIRAAMRTQTPVLGICLGAQLIAAAAGALVAPGPAPELGVSAVEILDADDMLLGQVAPTIPALHWHNECFDLPAGAVTLARSAQTPLQAFRIATSTWGLLCHLEADRAVIEHWLAVPAMAAEARAVLGPDFESRLRMQANQLDPPRAQHVFDAFAALCARRARLP
jgi:GMP synthase (glutamine-hydrolysing)